MADADYDFGGGFSNGSQSPRHGAREALAAAKVQRTINIAGGVTSLALVLGLGFWGYKLAVRDVNGVPVVQAMEGPMRIAPADPGGEVADHQGLSVNTVAGVGIAAPPPEKLVLAPRPVGLKATSAILSSLQVSSTPNSTFRVHSEYSGWTAAMGCTSCASRMCAEDHSETP